MKQTTHPNKYAAALSVVMAPLQFSRGTGESPVSENRRRLPDYICEG